MKINQIASFLIIIIISFWVLSELSTLLIPLVLALFVVMLLKPIFFFLKDRGVPDWLTVTLVSIFTLLVLSIFAIIVSETVSQITDKGPDLMQRIEKRMVLIVNYINFYAGHKLHLSEVMRNVLELNWITDNLRPIALALGSFTGSFGMFALYFIILLAGFSKYSDYISYVAGEHQKEHFLNLFETITHSVSSYMGVKFFVSLLTGLFFWGFCSLFGVQFGLFWGFLAFALNFIPSIGSIVATIPPIILGMIYIDALPELIIFAVFLTATQFVIGNILDPILTGNRLSLNTMTVIIGLLFWGRIWGAVGMLLSVPLLVLMKVIFEQFEATKMIARAMGSTGSGMGMFKKAKSIFRRKK